MSIKTFGWVVPAVAALGLSGLALASPANATTAAVPEIAPGAVSAVGPASVVPVLHTGSRGAAVRTWQIDIDWVADKVPGVPHIANDGIYGPKTATATRAFQRYAHIRIDGVVGPQTRAAMNTALHGSPTH